MAKLPYIIGIVGISASAALPFLGRVRGVKPSQQEKGNEMIERIKPEWEALQKEAHFSKSKEYMEIPDPAKNENDGWIIDRIQELSNTLPEKDTDKKKQLAEIEQLAKIIISQKRGAYENLLKAQNLLIEIKNSTIINSHKCKGGSAGDRTKASCLSDEHLNKITKYLQEN